MEEETIIIKRTLKGTRFKVTFELTFEEYAHFRRAEGQMPKRIPLNQNLVGEMKDLAARFEKLGWKGAE